MVLLAFAGRGGGVADLVVAAIIVVARSVGTGEGRGAVPGCKHHHHHHHHDGDEDSTMQ